LEDPDKDGVCNFLEYAFGSNPAVANSTGLPQPVPSATGVSMGFTVPSGVTDLNYGAECTTDLKTGTPVTNTGTGSRCTFTTPFTNGKRCYLRLKVTQKSS
jgi:hypothetical protein